jgi:hypothetical protein
MHKFNTAALRCQSLLLWRDPDRTKLVVCLLALVAVVCSVVPARTLTLAFCLLQLTKPLRSAGAGLATMSWRRFVGGLPTKSPSDPVYAPLGEGDGGADPVAHMLHDLETRTQSAGASGASMGGGASVGAVRVQYLR